MRLERFHTLLMVLALGLLASSPIPAHAAADVKAHETTATENTSFDTAEAKNPVAAAEDHEAGGLPQLNISTYPSQAFWLLVMFALLYVVFSKKTLPEIGAVIEDRRARIQADLDEAEHFTREAHTIQRAYEKSLSIARNDAAKAVLDVEQTAKNKAHDQQESFRRKADMDVRAAETRINQARDRAMGDMAKVAAEAASLAVSKITGANADVTHAQEIVDSIAGKAKAA